MKSLTKKQRRLIEELKKLTELLGLDYQNAVEIKPEWRSTHLELAKRQLIIGEVVTSYTLIDEHLNSIICNYFFGRKRSFTELWKTKRFMLFNHYILEGLSILEKLRLVKAIRKVPKTTAKNIESINALRNALAHAFFPENLRKWKSQYKGKDIFSLEGVNLFRKDVGDISEVLILGKKQKEE